MKRHTQRIVAFAVLGMAGCAFCVDRFVLGYSGPQAANAAGPTVSAPEAPHGRAAPVAGDAGSELSVSRRLAGLKDRLPSWGPENERDAMTIPSSWHIEPPPKEEKPEAVAVKKVEAPKFGLSAVMGGNGGALAVINGRMVKVGEQVDGYTVESISGGDKKAPASAVLTGPAGEVRVESVRPDDAVAEGPKADPAKPAPGKR